MADSLHPESLPSAGPMPDADGPCAPQKGGSAPVEAGGDSSGSGTLEPHSTGWTQPDDPTRASDRAPIVDLEGARIAGYQLLEELHRGGQGVVYKAIQLGTKRRVALKVMLEGPFASESTRRRFEREVELAASLRHPNVVTILDSGASDGRFYFAMEFIDGLRLDRYLAKHRPSFEATLVLFEKICEAVNFAHQRGVIHRDLKPPNILVDANGEPHILDFGLAKPAQPANSEGSTLQVLSTAGQLLGTVAYMSPEQSIGSQDVDVRSDVYSLGVVFYEALVGELPYTVEGPLGEVLTRIAADEPQRPRALRRSSRFGTLLNDELETILLKALEKDPTRRYQTAGDLGRDLHHLLSGEPIEAKRASGLYVFRKALRRYRLQAAAAGSVLVTLIVFLVLFAILWHKEREAADRANEQQKIALAHAAEAQQARDEANRGKQDLEQALVEQTIQRGKLAQVRGDLVAARDYYWDAYERGSPAAHWALREYYEESGDGGAAVLYCANEGPVAISRDGALAAFCETPESITVRRIADGQTLRWLRAPGRLTVLSVSDDGTLCAGGTGWARLWRPDSSNPLLARELSDGFGLRGVHALSGESLVLVGERSVRLVRPSQTDVDTPLKLLGAPTGNSDCLPEHSMVAVATSAGVELVVAEEGVLRSELVGLRDLASPPRYVLFAGNHLFAATQEALFHAEINGSTLDAWKRSRDVPVDWRRFGDWDLLDINPASRTVVVGMRDGRIELFCHGRSEHTWHVAAGLVEVHLTADGTVLTLDKAGTVTRWGLPAPQVEDRLILRQPPAKWTVADDGSALLVADEGDRVFAYAPQCSAACEPIPMRRGLRRRLPGSGELALAVSHDADHVVICMDGAIRLRDRASGTAYNATWKDAEVPVLKAVALTGDGQHLAFYAQSEAGDRQRISFYRWQPRVQTTRSIDLATLLPACGPAVEFVGSAIREVAFVPGTDRLVVARTNAELVLVDAEASQSGVVDPGAEPVEPPEAWTTLDSPAMALSFDAQGEQLAVACDDGFIRVLTVADAALKRRIRPPEPAYSLSFNPDGQVLLARGSGDASVIDVATGECVLQVPARDADPGLLAAWIGRSDARLLGQADGIYEHDYRRADEIIAQNRSYARQRAVARQLAEGEVERAWAETESLGAVAPACADNMRVLVLEAALRRRSQDIPPAWLACVADTTDPAVWLRLGHAAYEGERFDQAGLWLSRGAELTGGQLDAYTVLRIAQCRYLAGDYLAAAKAFGELTQRSDLDSGLLPTVQLEQVAALVLGRDFAKARSIAARIGGYARSAVRIDPGAMDAARDIARTLTGLETERPVLAFFTQLAAEVVAENLRGVDLRFHDDAHFFEGELARISGKREDAIASYQRCIDLARDEWPSGWARYRLRQLSAGS
jgi:tRNA A-37 threonylcarbamoyl transferase component Bud32/tetratricopeptide (TPR) repeat protein